MKNRMKITISPIGHKPNDTLPKHIIKTVNELYQVATLDNLERLFTDMKAAFTIVLNYNEITKNKEKFSMNHFEWCDDWTPEQIKEHADAMERANNP